MAKPYKAIPGPKGPFGLGNLYNYLPLIGKYSWKKLHLSGNDKYCKYGTIVREKMLPGVDIVWLYDPKDISSLLNEREYPQRRSHLALEKYRKDRPHIYKTSGLLPTNGVEWWRLRSELQKGISSPCKVKHFFAEADLITKEFIGHLPIGQKFDLLPLLARLNLELTGAIIFGERFNSFSSAEMDPKSRTSLLIKAAETTNSSILPTDQGVQLWKLFETKVYKRLRKAQEYMESVAIDLVSNKYAQFQTKKHSTQNGGVIENYFKNSNLSLSDVVGAASDFLLAGIDTTSYTEAFCMYHLGKDSEVQMKIFNEAKLLLKKKESIMSEVTFRNKISYTKAALKEVYRLSPISVGVGRVLNRDTVFSNYLVPKGTVVVTQNMVSCRLEKYFKNPLVFNPDRWLNKGDAIHPYLVLPFGHGMRSCVARRFAEQNILIFIIRLIRNFDISWEGDFNIPLEIETLLINKPASPLNVKLKRKQES